MESNPGEDKLVHRIVFETVAYSQRGRILHKDSQTSADDALAGMIKVTKEDWNEEDEGYFVAYAIIQSGYLDSPGDPLDSEYFDVYEAVEDFVLLEAKPTQDGVERSSMLMSLPEGVNGDELLAPLIAAWETKKAALHQEYGIPTPV